MARWGVGVLTPDTAIAWDLVVINAVGAFLLGSLPLLRAVRHSHRLTVALGPGLLGGFTTVSAWSDDVRRLLDDGKAGSAGVVVALTLAAGLLAAHLGRRLAHRPEPPDALT